MSKNSVISKFTFQAYYRIIILNSKPFYTFQIHIMPTWEFFLVLLIAFSVWVILYFYFCMNSICIFPLQFSFHVKATTTKKPKWNSISMLKILTEKVWLYSQDILRNLELSIIISTNLKLKQEIFEKFRIFIRTHIFDLQGKICFKNLLHMKLLNAVKIMVHNYGGYCRILILLEFWNILLAFYKLHYRIITI